MFKINIKTMQEFIIKTNQNFSFLSTVYSHGWSDLLPFKIDINNKILNYSLEISPSVYVLIAISSDSKNNLIINKDNTSQRKHIGQRRLINTEKEKNHVIYV